MTTESDRDAFRALVTEAAALTKAGDSDGANAEIAKLEQLVNGHHDPVAFLQPLTAEDESADVQYNAGAALLNLGHSGPGLRALDAVAASGDGTASARAKMLARSWRRRHPEDAG